MSVLKCLAVTVVAASLCSCSKSGESTASPAPSEAASEALTTSAAPAASAPAASATPGVNVAFTDIAGIEGEQAIKDEATLGVFDASTAKFDPTGTISRGEFVEWLVKANNLYFASAPEHRIRPAESGSPSFVDVAAANPYFKYVQGMHDAGFVIGIDDKHFAPDRPLTREEMIAIKEPVDRGGAVPDQPDSSYLGDVTDRSQINRHYWGAIYEDHTAYSSHNLGRVYGTFKTMHPQQAVTRAEAAVCLSVISGHAGDGSAAVALGRSPAP